MQIGKSRMLEDAAFEYLQDNPDGKVLFPSANGFNRTIKNVKQTEKLAMIGICRKGERKFTIKVAG